MNIETIRDSIKNSMKCGATLQVETLRGALAAIQKAAIDKRCEITDELVDEVLLKEEKILKEMYDSCPENRCDLLEEYAARLEILSAFVPKLISDPVEIVALIEAILAKNWIEIIPSNKGRAMKVIMPALKGKVDMAVANKIIKEIFS